MKKRIILHIDMNSYFASVEQQANPFLRGRSVGVVAYPSANAVIIASSVEAKSKGIKTGCRVNEAKKLDPNIVLIENEPEKYRFVTKAIFNILKNYSNKIEPYSIDEAFMDLTDREKDIKSAINKAQEMQKRIKKEVGCWLNSSIGISWTKFLAKFASDIAPAKSILVIPDRKTLNKLLRQHALRDVWGINHRTEKRLKALQINSLWQLKNADWYELKRHLGRYGYYLWANVNGYEISNVKRGLPTTKSISRSYSLPQKTTDKNYLNAILYKLCEKAGRVLRKSGREAHTIHFFAAYIHGGGIKQRKTMPTPLFTTEEIFKPTQKWLNKSQLIFPVKKLAVSLSGLTLISKQMSLFNDNLRNKNLSMAIDKINSKFGEYTLLRGQMFNLDDVAPDRIGFGKIAIK